MEGFEEVTKVEDATHALLRFHPQVWQNDIPVTGDDTEEFIVPIEDAMNDEGKLVEERTYEADQLRSHPNASEKAAKWPGPFEITIKEFLATDGHECIDHVEIDPGTGDIIDDDRNAEFEAMCPVCGQQLIARYGLYGLQKPETGEWVYER